MAKLKSKQRLKIVDALISNCGCQEKPMFLEDDRELLMNTDDARLVALLESADRINSQFELVGNMEEAGLIVNGKIPPQFMNKKKKDDEEDNSDDDDSETCNEEDDEEEEEEQVENERKPNKKKKKKEVVVNKNVDLKTSLKGLHPQIRGVVLNMLRREQGEKDKLIELITSNERNIFTEEQLAEKDLNELEAISALIGNAEDREIDRVLAPRKGRGNFSGAGSPIGNRGRVNNEENADDDDLLALPTMNWSENSVLNKKKSRSK